MDPGPETVLVTDDLKEVRSCIWDAQVKWFHLGVELGLRPSSLEAIRTKFRDDPAECFSQMLMDWLAGQGSEPTWKNIFSALNAPPVHLPALAKAVEAKYIQASQQSGVEALFPFLSKDMAKHVRTNLIHYLMKDTTKIKHGFITLEFRLQEALKELGITAEKVIQIFSREDPRFHEVFKECDSIDKVFNEGRKYWSFFDYALIELLIGCLFGEKHDINLRLKAYITDFQKYARRRVCECPSNVFGDKEENGKTLVFKIEECNFETMTLKELEELCFNLNSAIGSYHLRLLKTDPGCIQLTFRALPNADEMIQKLTKEEQQALRNMGVLSIIYGEQTLNLVSLSEKIAEEAAKNSESDLIVEITEKGENSDSSDTNPPSPTLSLEEPMAALQVKGGDNDDDSAFSDVTEASVATYSRYGGSMTLGHGTDISDKSKDPVNVPTAMGYPTVWVGGLKGIVREKDLTENFSQFGKILHVMIFRDKETKKSKHCGFVIFGDERTAEHAARMRHGSLIYGQRIMARGPAEQRRRGHSGKYDGKIGYVPTTNDDLRPYTDCIHYVNRMCTNGSSCPYRHQSTLLYSTSLCEAWSSGKSCRDVNCPKRHPGTSNQAVGANNDPVIPIHSLSLYSPNQDDDIIRLATRQEYTQVSTKFKNDWAKAKGALPDVKAVFIIENDLLKMKWRVYNDSLPRLYRETEQHYHGTKLLCNITVTKDLCCSSDCGICGISESGFKRHKISHNILSFQRFGPGFYLAPKSSKCHDYTQGAYNYRALLLCDVSPGNKYKLAKNDQSLNGPPDGYHSIHGVAGGSLNYEEIVLSNPDAIIPKYIIIYQKDGVDKIVK